MKRIVCLLIITLFTVNISVAQESDTSEVYIIVTDMPEFPGGQEAMFEFIARNIVYPTEAKNANITGIIYINFVVEKDGSLSNIKQAEGSDDIGGGCLEEAIRVVKLMPNWSPGKQRDEIHRISYVLPIQFMLSGNNENDKEVSDKKKGKKGKKTRKK